MKSGVFEVLGISVCHPPLLWGAFDFPLGKHHHRTEIEALFLGAALSLLFFRLRFRVGVKSRKKRFRIDCAFKIEAPPGGRIENLRFALNFVIARTPGLSSDSSCVGGVGGDVAS